MRARAHRTSDERRTATLDDCAYVQPEVTVTANARDEWGIVHVRARAEEDGGSDLTEHGWQLGVA